MRRYVIEDTRHIPPFNEPASLLTIGTEPLKILHEQLFLEVLNEDIDLAGIIDSRDQLYVVEGEAVVYRDSLWFDKEFFEYFIREARRIGRACRAAFPTSDKAFHTYTLPLTKGFQATATPDGQFLFLADLWYFPDGFTEDVDPIVVPGDAKEIGFYSVPDFMTMEQGDLTHYAPMRALISIEIWVHIYFATIIFGNFGRAARLDRKIETSVFTQLKMLWSAVVEQKQILSASGAVKMGKNCTIHPSATITGPASIGDNCNIGAGAIVDNCTIGDNVTIDDGCVLMMSTVADNCFLSFRTAQYLTAVMENTIIAQNSCLQMCVIGRNSFVGAGSTFTDFNLIAQKPIRAANIEGELQSVGQIVLGSAIGHNCRIGSGMVIFPGRMIESDVVVVASPQRRVISRNITFEESDHHFIKFGDVHKRFYPRKDELENEVESSWDTW
jgi:carbonic anhydrase/acetyltransferase-like protein (isoleucine patch superfamily)